MCSSELMALAKSRLRYDATTGEMFWIAAAAKPAYHKVFTHV